jgi:hypothetical protein
MSESLPEQTTDDTDVGWGDEVTSDDDDDERLRDGVPPHHIDRD